MSDAQRTNNESLSLGAGDTKRSAGAQEVAGPESAGPSGNRPQPEKVPGPPPSHFRNELTNGPARRTIDGPERLRAEQKLLHREAEMFRQKGNQTLYAARLKLARSLGEAADEIDRLRKAMEEGAEWDEKRQVEWERQQAEIERLRAGLQKLVTQEHHPMCAQYPHGIGEAEQGECSCRIGFIRKLLAGEAT